MKTRRKRNYESDTKYESSPEQIRRRSMRNKARRKMLKKYGKAALEGRDVDHVSGVGRGNSDSNLRIVSKHKNRAFRRRSDHTQIR